MTTKTEKAAETNAFSALGEALESAAEKFEEGSSVARESAKNAAQATRKVFAGGVYKTAYWVSYGLRGGFACYALSCLLTPSAPST